MCEVIYVEFDHTRILVVPCESLGRGGEIGRERLGGREEGRKKRLVEGGKGGKERGRRGRKREEGRGRKGE